MTDLTKRILTIAEDRGDLYEFSTADLRQAYSMMDFPEGHAFSYAYQELGDIIASREEEGL